MTAPIKCAHAEVWPIDRLKPHPRNPNTHPAEQLRLLGKVIGATGWRSPIVVSKRSGLIVKGHGRLEAAKMAGLTECPVDLQDYADEAEELADLIADNRLAELAEISLPDLKDLLQELDTGAIDMELTGFGEAALADLFSQFQVEGEADAEPQTDRAEELRAKWGVEAGQIWRLGEHRLLCGDSTKAEDVARLLGTNQPAALISDPPYGMGFDASWYGGKTAWGTDVASPTKHTGAAAWDAKPFDPSHLFGIARKTALFGANFYCTRLPEDGTWWCWDKHITKDGDTPTWYGMPFEMIWMTGKREHRIIRHLWAGFTRKAEKVDKERFHPTQKPVAVLRELVEYLTASGDEVFEPYAGSGTTLIACENLGRRCYAMEISPAYVAVTLQRYADATGKIPILANA